MWTDTFEWNHHKRVHAIELRLLLWRWAKWRHWKCDYTQLKAATINHLCSAAVIPKFMTLRSEMKTPVSLETTIELHVLLYYLKLVHHSQMAGVSPLDHHCLFWKICFYYEFFDRYSKMTVMVMMPCTRCCTIHQRTQHKVHNDVYTNSQK